LTLPDGKITLLRDLLVRLIEDSIEHVEHWPHYVSRYRHLTSALAAFCLRQFDETGLPSEGLIEAAVIATRLKDNEFGDEKPAEELMGRLRTDSQRLAKIHLLSRRALLRCSCAGPQ
jgi:hypothetical protein